MKVSVTSQACALICITIEIHHDKYLIKGPSQYFENDRCILHKQEHKPTLGWFCVSTLSNFQMYLISFPYHSFPFQDPKEKRILKGNSLSYHHDVIPLSLGLVLERCLLATLQLLK